ncbi:MAG: hypothetical protein COU51_00155 [Parcubacteria group bacterium CG10_big_fil_rev_8_21_14_0_10_36_14]|nr:MAG: hypothetical protein COU51_00155 [Parcubacteria group bacterium CG10_big_fil_rev_8_21_14_0_10_36_14]
MLPVVYISDWNKFNLSQVVENYTFSVIIPDSAEVRRILVNNKRVRVILTDKKGRVEFVLGEAEVTSHMHLPIGKIFPHMWAMHIGERYVETFMEQNSLSRFAFIIYIAFKINNMNSEFSFWLHER